MDSDIRILTNKQQIKTNDESNIKKYREKGEMSERYLDEVCDYTNEVWGIYE